MIPIHELKLQLLYSNIVKTFAPDFEEVGLLFETPCSLSIIKDRLDKLKERILYLLSAMNPDEFEAIASSHLHLYMLWLSCVCYYGGGLQLALDYLSKAPYN